MATVLVMSDIDDLLAQVPMGQVAGQLGVDEREAATATRSALGALLGGLQANAQDPGGAASLQEALGQHGGELDDGVDVGSIDTDDGGKIVDHIFGDSRDQVVDRLSNADTAQGGLGGMLGGKGGGLLAKLLPLLAPIVMAWLSKKLAGGLDGGRTAPADVGSGGSEGSSGGGLGDILGDVFGPGGRPRADGGSSSPAPAEQPADSGGTGGLGDILGDLLGRGRKG